MTILFNKGIHYQCQCHYETDDYTKLLTHQQETSHSFFYVIQ